MCSDVIVWESQYCPVNKTFKTYSKSFRAQGQEGGKFLVASRFMS